MHSLNRIDLCQPPRQTRAMKNKILSLRTGLTAAAVLLVSANIASAQQPQSNKFWWPEKLDLSPLRQNSTESNPLGKDFNYAKIVGATTAEDFGLANQTEAKDATDLGVAKQYGITDKDTLNQYW